MKRIVLITLLVLVHICTFGQLINTKPTIQTSTQKYISFEYDETGNRVSRYQTNEKFKEEGKSDSTATLQPGFATTGDNSHNVYLAPSPTEGPIQLSIPDYAPDKKGVCVFVNVNNGAAKTFNFTGSQNTFDLSDLNSGIYVTHVILDLGKDQKQYELKIIKK